MASKKKRQEAAKEILTKGLKKLQKKWVKDTLAVDAGGNSFFSEYTATDEVGGVCAIGALSYAQGNITDDVYEMTQAMKDAACVLYAALPEGARTGGTDLADKVGAIENWNDAPTRKKKEVVDAFKRAIAMCDE